MNLLRRFAMIPNGSAVGNPYRRTTWHRRRSQPARAAGASGPIRAMYLKPLGSLRSIGECAAKIPDAS